MSHLPDLAAGNGPRPEAPERLLSLIHKASSAGRALRRLLAEQAAAVELTDAELLVVWLCGDTAGRGVVQGDLASAIGVSPALMSGTVERLRQQELIEMQRCSIDRRRQVWRTTDRGRVVLERIGPQLVRLCQRLDARLPVEDQQTVRRLCERLFAAAGELEGAAGGEDTERKGRRAA
jgi:DNA-binding MarR family transcriptional regulator